ncbi:MAG: carboxypeptidase regulatory-like domain-containing protein, partial [Vicinamibacterales bacterium]
MRTAVLALAVVLSGASVSAQAPASLTVQVVDPSGAGIPHAIVVVKNEARAFDVTADAAGAATVALPAGSYQLIASADGFDTRTETVRATAGRARRVEIELPLSRVLETLTVTPEQATAAETTIGSEEIEALADDPDALEDFIRDVGGPDATVSVDGFRGGRVPPKEQVAQLIVTTDPYSAQFHEVGSSRVDVITKPGFGNWEGRTNLNFSSDALSARNPFATEKLPFHNVSGRFSASGPVKRLRTSVALDADIRRRNETQPLVALTPEGLVRSEVDQRDERHSLQLRTTHSIGKEGILRVRTEWDRSERVGAGLSDVDLPERALASRDHELTLRASLINPLPQRVRQELRFSVDWESARQSPATEAIAIDVLGAFRSGGAQSTGSVTRRNVEGVAEWLFPARGRHTLRTGLLVEQTRHESSNVRNYLGTFVFAGLDAWLARRPITFTQRIGSTDIRFSDTRTGVFVQDDIRLTQTLSMGLGLRQELQPSIDDLVNVAPRVSLAWTTKARTVLRFGVGAFYDWHDTSLIEEAQRLEGNRSFELVVRNPGYPDPLVGGTSQAPLPPTRLVTAGDLGVARVWRASTTFERRFGRAVNLRSTVSRQVGRAEPRSRNVNAPVNGVRPDSSSGNVLLLGSTGRSERTAAETNLTLNGLWQRRLFGHINYTFGEVLNDADGALSLPANNLHPEREWGPARQDIRHRGFAGISFRIPTSFSMGFTTRWQSASPYNITTGEDTNGDTVTNDRPAGISRNAARGQGFWTTDLH